MSQPATHSIANFIWGIADDVLRDIYVRGKYRDVILPMTVIRRLDALLEPTKEAVLKMKQQLDAVNIANQSAPLYQASGQAFYNTSPFTLRDLKARAKSQQLKADFEAYLDGFSTNVQEILDKFKFRNQIPHMVENDILGNVIEKFLDTSINLSSKPILDVNGNEKLPALDNHAMGTVFEELIRRFNEENNEEAGEHFTPRDVVKLMADLIFLPIADQIQSGTYLVYDGACGTGGMLTVAEERLQELAKAHRKEVSTHLYGQECQPETYAICKADLLLKGEGEEAMNIKFGSTLSADAYPSQEFDFMLSNPPYGKSWKTDLERMGGKDKLKDARFSIQHGDDPEFTMLTRSSDGQLMFLVNKLMKMKNNTPLGSRIAQVHNGSSLFTGDAGQGESNIRRWVIENDWLEAIIALPENTFYNTGIATYIWVLTNRKPSHKKGKVQLIDASNWYVPLRKNLGKKNCEFSDEHMKMICDLLIDFRETEQSKIFPNQAFGYSKITVERPLRLQVDLSAENLSKFCRTCGKEGESDLADFISAFAKEKGATSFNNYNEFIKLFEEHADKVQLKLTKKRKDLIRNELATIDENAEPVIKKAHKPGKVTPNPLEGLYELIIDGKKCVVEHEADSNLRDTEQVLLIEEGGIEAFFKREVQPYTSDAWMDASKTQIGYEISFTKHFYKPIKMRSLGEINKDILSLEAETEGLLLQIIGKVD
ncbi:type I restriction-modification system subunit M [Criblamydia sequanensis]|uniref:site-specific DNA-methyltransferase (adenine-specific) n=1 Tax=Candidatus Criblamydia sequanensis CRIB-18 TaxID=1437425 RepID=A0A090D1E3_9BACT|nr:class I SAM-dependent DNA methyltransferase [Criblamydia sequanensis]CDR33740.1 Type I restriction enzyme, M subunit [Criblamydia sequanensis CRIB-18]